MPSSEWGNEVGLNALLKALETEIFWKNDLEAKGLEPLDGGLRYIDRRGEFVTILVKQPGTEFYKLDGLYRRVN